MGRYEEAIKVLVPLYNKYNKGYTLNLRFGWLFYLNKNYRDAIKYYQKASLINPYSLDPRLGLIRIYLDTQSYQKASQKAYEVLKIDYYNYYANLYVIQALIAQKKFEIAYKIAKKMLALYPTDISFLELLATIYKKTNDKRLEQLLKDILILDPNNILVRDSLK
jgi:tetratricopeptide (TPR) repeat protein